MKHLYKFCIALIILSFAAADMLYAQQEIMVRELHEYGFELESQADLPGHPKVGEEVTFDAVIVSYPKNSGLASITDAGVPGRIHVFVTDVNAIEEGEEGMSIQIVVEGSQRVTLEGLNRGDVISVTGQLSFFNNISQFDATDVELLGSIIEEEYEDLAPLLEPTVINISDLNIASEQEGLYRWNAENYTQFINRYVKLEGLEVIDYAPFPANNRPWYTLSDGTSILSSNDTSLRFRNDKPNYAYNPEDDEGLGYNYRRPDVDGDFVPPAPGSIVDISGFVVVNTFNPSGLDETAAQSTLKIAPWDDGVVWQNDGDDPADRLTPEDWPNDFQVLGFAPILQNLEITPEQILSSDEATVSIDVLRPEDDYTVESVEIEYMVYSYTEDQGELVTGEMTSAGGDTYTFTFDEQDEFTTVDFEIVATVATPEGVETRARESGTFFVESATQTSPVVLTPAAGTYVNQVSVSMSSATDDATIYYTLDGEDPDEDSEEYTTPLQIEETTTVRAIAIADGLDNSPVNTRIYEIEVQIVEVSTLAELRAGSQDGTTYEYTGEAVVTYARPSDGRNQIFLMDDTGGILIDDPNGIITSNYAIGDVMTNVIGTLGEHNTVVQFLPAGNPGDPQSTADVEPVTITLDELDYATHQSMLIRVENTSFVESGEFSFNTNYGIYDATIDVESPVIFRTSFEEANYLDDPIPEEEINLTAIVGGFGNNAQLIARSDADFELATSSEIGESPYVFALDQNYPNPFNPSTRINYSLAETAEVQLVVYDILGRRVASLVNGIQTAGTYTINFDMSRFASGTYIYRLEAGDFVSVRKMMLIK